MAHCTYFFALLSTAVVAIDATYGVDNTDFNYEDDCMSPVTACRDLEVARLCNAYEFCKKQAIPCGAKKFLDKGDSISWAKSLDEVDKNCAGNYEPFKKIYGSPDLVDIKLEVTPGRKPFTLSFNFEGNPTGEIRESNVRIKLNENVVYDDVVHDTTPSESYPDLPDPAQN